MKVSEAEQLICPFIIYDKGYDMCKTTKCMAWKYRTEYENKKGKQVSYDGGYCQRINNE